MKEALMDDDSAEQCAFCRQRTVTVRDEALAFYQSTDRGFVLCRVVIPMSVCDRCGNRSWDERGEALIEEAVLREYEKLP